MKFKQLLSVVLMLCMVASSLVAFAAPSYDASYNCSSISFGYEDGEVWTDASSLEGGQTITGKVTVSTTGEEENMVFSMFVYKNGKMIDGEICTLPVGSTAVEFKASADIPTEAEGCQLVAVLWNNFYDMKMICDAALFPGTNTKLRALYLDGVKLEGFDPDVTEYTYAIEPNAEKYPEITWETTDASVKATYIAPKSFPGIAIVRVEAADGQKTDYSIKYESIVGDFISNVGGLATNPCYIKGGVKVGSDAYNDRDYFITAINAPEYEGADLIQGSITWQSDNVYKGAETVDWITFETTRGVTVKVLKSDTGATAHFIEEGWTLEQTTMEGGFVQTTTNVVKNHTIAMSKHFAPGKVAIPNGKSGTTYIVAILLDPIGYVPEGGDEEPEVVVDETLDLASLSVDGVEIENFDAHNISYSYVLSAEQAANVTAPVVTCTLADETSTVEIKAPKTFPGNATITVTNAKGNSRVYTIKYTSEKVSGLALNETLPENTPVAAFAENFQAGATVFADRPTTFFATEINDAFAIGKDRIQLCAGWRFDEKPYVDIYKGATLIKDWLSFTVARDTIVTIYEDADNDSFYTGYEKETATDSAYIVAPYGTSPLEYDVKYSKVFKAGAKVEIPNANKSQRTGMIVLTYAPWGEEFDEGQVPDVPVVPDEPEDHTLCLADLKIDGETVNGFAEDVFTFTHTLTSAQLTATDAPAITYTLADATSSAVVTKPDTFPGSAKITVTSKAGDSRTYTVNYVAELVADLATDVEGKSPVYVAGGIKTNGNVASDRIGTAETTWRILSYSEALAGNDTILSNVEGWVGDVTEVKFTLGRKAKVKVLLNDHAGTAASNLNKYTAVGFTADPDTTNEKITIIRKPANGNEDIRPYTFMATKVFEAGEVSVPYTKPNMPVVIAVEYLPWGGEFTEPIVPDEPEVDALALSDIKVDGVSVTGFSADVTEYNHVLTAVQLANTDAPAVTYTLADETSSAAVVNPTEFPGKVTVTVTSASGATRDYVINYNYTDLVTNITTDPVVTKNAVYVPGGIKMGGRVASDRMASSNWAINMLIPELDGQDAILTPVDGWINVVNTFSFDLGREADITILQNNVNMLSSYPDFTPNADTTSVKLRIGNNGGAGQTGNDIREYRFMATKTFEAGKVTLPFTKPNMPVLTALKFAPWGEDQGEESDEDYYEQSIGISPVEGDIVVSGGFKANKTDEGYYVVLETYDDNGNLINTEKSDKRTVAEGKNTFSVSFAPNAQKQNVKAYAETESGVVICEPVEKTIKTLKHLFIGNSFSVNAHKYLYNFAKEAGYNNIVLGTLYKGGCSLETHASYAQQGTAGYTYYKNTTGNWNTTANSTLLAGLTDEDWMTISFQQASATSGQPETYDPHLTSLMAYVDANKTNPDAKYVWHMTWAYAQEKVTNTYGKDQLTMYNAIVNAVQTKVLTKDAFEIVIPSGTAIQNARTSSVGDTLNGDGTHLEEIHGCYIAGLMTFKALTGEDISGISFDSGFTHDNFLAIAKESVNNAYAKPYEVTQSAYPGQPVVPDEPAEDALVNSISLDGEKIADFNKDTLEYTVTLTDDQLAADSYPEVTYDVAEGADASVTNPVSFPGFAEIKVTKGTEEKTYKINYEVPKIQVNLTELAPAGTPKATVLDAMTIGTPVFSDRNTFPVEAINDPDIEGTLWLRSASGWRNDEKDYRNLYMGSVINDWISFEVKRGAVVTVYEDSISNTSRFAYWTSEASEETPYIKATHATPLNYIAKHQRYFAAGETVEIPNLIGSRLYTATIKYLGWNEEAPELDVVIPEVKRISYSDLIPKIASGANANVTPGMWNGLSINTSTKYQLSKEFDGITEPTEITLTTDKIAKGYGIIVVAPLNETDDKNVIVNPDGSELEWTEYNNIVTDYAYTNDGDEDFDPANATYGMRNDTAATYTGGKAYVYANMNNSDDMYITGSALASTRLPYAGELHWTDLPEEYLGCNYIVIPFDGGFDGGVKEFTFTVNQPVKIYVHSGSSNMTVTDTISNDAWASSQYAVTRRYQNVLDHLSCAYMIKKGYINESNVVFDGKIGSSNGVRFNRYDVYENLKADCGSYVGWVIDPEKAEATGFTETINDYRYEEYLEAWVD